MEDDKNQDKKKTKVTEEGISFTMYAVFTNSQMKVTTMIRDHKKALKNQKKKILHQHQSWKKKTHQNLNGNHTKRPILITADFVPIIK